MQINKVDRWKNGCYDTHSQTNNLRKRGNDYMTMLKENVRTEYDMVASALVD